MVDKINKEKMAADYGFALSFMRSDPELWNLFNQAVKQTWDANRFVAKLRNTDWFKHHSANVRNAIMQETSDPATYKANVDQMYSTVKDAWGSMFGEAFMDDKQLRTWAETAHRMGWSQAQLMDHMSSSIDYRKLLQSKDIGGTAAEIATQLDNLTQSYGVNLGQKWKSEQVSKLVSGNDTISGVQRRVQELAMREYKAFADRIAGGETVQSIADPYVQKMSDLLELNPNDVNVSDKRIQAALKQTTPDGKPAAMDLHTFEDYVRKDNRWQYTDNAKQQVAGATQDLLRSFGLMA